MDLTEAEDIKKRWQEYTEDLHTKNLHDPDSHGGVITHLELDILECEFKWALGSITTNKASGSDGIPVKLFSSVHFIRSVMSDSLRLHEPQHARPPCPSPTPGVHSDSHPSSQ